MTILYADDDADDRFLLREVLDAIDPEIECIMVRDGRQALEVLKVNEELPDMILLDVNMPVMNGAECLAHLKEDSRLCTIPVVIYSTTNSRVEIDRYLALGANNYVHKPSTCKELYAEMDNLIKDFEISRKPLD